MQFELALTQEGWAPDADVKLPEELAAAQAARWRVVQADVDLRNVLVQECVPGWQQQRPFPQSDRAASIRKVGQQLRLDLLK